MEPMHAFGIKDIQLPIRVKQRDGGIQHSVASIQLSVKSSQENGDSIFRILTDSLQDFSGDFSVSSYSALLTKIQKGLNSECTRLIIDFPYFIEKTAPVSNTKSLMEYSCIFDGELSNETALKLCVQVPVTTLCPCSKEISIHGAHNQRAEVVLSIQYDGFIWLEELIELVESSASCELFALLKRPDEKYVTEQAYNNPMFVEDVVRKVSENAAGHPHITWFSVSVESFESIHKHSAYAFVDSKELGV